MYEDETPVEVGDDTLTVIDQAAKMGWRAGLWDFGRAESPGQIEHFNPGLVRRADGLHLLVRRSEVKAGMPYGQNGIWACKLDDEDFRKPVGGPPLRFPESLAEEQFEDPRAVYWNGQTWVAVVNFTWFTNMTWTGAHIALGVFGNDPMWSPIARRDPEVGTNSGQRGNTYGKHNKNVLFWFKDDKLHCLYTSDPWSVVVFGNGWKDQTPYTFDGVRWKYGWVRGGTPPVLVNGLYYTFFHSSMPWRGRYRRYYMGAIAFNSEPPFTPVHWTQDPILIGSQNDPWQQRKPLVVFPCGAVHENDRWLISFGVNDLKCGYLELPHVDLLKILAPALVVPGMSLLADKTERGSMEPVPFTDKPDEGEEANNLSSDTGSSVRAGSASCVTQTNNLVSDDNRPNDVVDGGSAHSVTVPQIPAVDDEAPNGPSNSAARLGEGQKCEAESAQNSSQCQNNAQPAETGTEALDAELLSKQRANMAKARAILAASRAAGELRPARRKRKRRKRKTLKAGA